MRILLLQFYSHQPTPAYHELSSNLRSLGLDVIVGTPDDSGKILIKERENVIYRTKVELPGFLNLYSKSGILSKAEGFFHGLRVMLELRQIIGRLKPEVVQINPSLTASLALPLLMPRKTVFIQDIRQLGLGGKPSFKGRLKDWFTLHKTSIATKHIFDHTFFCHSLAAQKTLGSHWSAYASVIPVGVDEQFLKPLNLSRKRQGPIRFIYLGTLSKVRMLETIIDAAKEVKSKTRDFKVDMVGPDEAEGYYQRLIKEKGVEDVVTVKPPVAYHNVPRILLDYDVGLAYVPPRPDWMYQPTLKVLEYRALGMPVIATNNPPNREIVVDGANGLLIGPEEESLYKAMLRFIEEEDFLRGCKEKAQDMRIGRNWMEISKMHAEIYRRLCNQEEKV